MSMREGWTYNGQHFSHTRTEIGGNRYFIDGKPTAKAIWQELFQAASYEAAEQPKPRRHHSSRDTQRTRT